MTFDIEEQIAAVCSLMEERGYWPLVVRQRPDRAYVTACIPPMSFGKKASPTAVVVRVALAEPDKADPPPSVHPGGLSPSAAVKEAVRRFRETHVPYRPEKPAWHRGRKAH